MALEAFAEWRSLTMGIELELQLVNFHDYDLVESAEDAIYQLDREGRLLHLNSSGQRLLGFGPGENWQQLKLPDLYPPWAAANPRRMRLAATGGRPRAAARDRASTPR